MWRRSIFYTARFARGSIVKYLAEKLFRMGDVHALMTEKLPVIFHPFDQQLPIFTRFIDID